MKTIQNWPVDKKKHLMSLFSTCINDLVIDLVPGLSAERYEANKGNFTLMKRFTEKN